MYKKVDTCKEHFSPGNCSHTKPEAADTAFRQYVQKEVR